jgi:alpha-L-fucosidase
MRVESSPKDRQMMSLKNALCAVSCGLFLNTSGAPAQPPAGRTAWYHEAKFGMFIHWGPYSLASVEASWPIMTPQRTQFGAISEAEYRALPQRFNPAKFDPQAWVRLARAAGQRYMVFTTKHHDGFSMFDSAHTDYKITRTPYGKDILAQLAEACQAQKMPLGFYYSPPDMNHPGFRDTSKPAAANWNGEPERPEWASYLDYMDAQLRELLTNYGNVAILWFDGLRNQQKYRGERFHSLIRQLQPACLINNRIGLPGDYDTPEQFIPAAIPTRSARVSIQGVTPPKMASAESVPDPADFRLWETCMTINNTWGYNANDRNFKSATKLIRTLVEVASRGGNFLLNVGPAPDGTIQPEFEERLLEIGKWMRVNGESIYGSTYGPLQNLPFGKTTAKGRVVYLHLFEWPRGKLELAGLKGEVYRVTMLAARKRLTFQPHAGGVAIQLPAEAPDPHVSVLKLEMK